jgi:chromosome partitioning protein
MKTILVCNQKGGVGKSTIVDELAFSLDRTGTPYNLFDLDGQGGLIHEAVENPVAEVTLIDTPGALRVNMRDWIGMADVIIIPTLPSSRDLIPLQTMLDLVKDSAAKVYIVINEYSPAYVASKAFNSWLETECELPVVCIPRSEVVLQAGMAGQSVVDYAPHHAIVLAIKRMVNTVREAVGLSQEN